MSEREWAAKMALCKKYVIKEMKKKTQDGEIETITGLFFFEVTVSFRNTICDETKKLMTPY